MIFKLSFTLLLKMKKNLLEKTLSNNFISSTPNLNLISSSAKSDTLLLKDTKIALLQNLNLSLKISPPETPSKLEINSLIQIFLKPLKDLMKFLSKIE
jgi:hypothetical protein